MGFPCLIFVRALPQGTTPLLALVNPQLPFSELQSYPVNGLLGLYHFMLSSLADTPNSVYLNMKFSFLSPSSLLKPLHPITSFSISLLHLQHLSDDSNHHSPICLNQNLRLCLEASLSLIHQQHNHFTLLIFLSSFLNSPLMPLKEDKRSPHHFLPGCL